MKKIVVAQGACAPIRNTITGTLRPYGVQHRVIAWQDHEALAWAQVASVHVSDRAAKWAEYLLLRSGRYRLVSKPLDPRNERWAVQWNGRMPQPWVEAGCKVQRKEQPDQPKRRAWWQRFNG